MEILIKDRHTRHRIPHDEIERKAAIILKALGVLDGELSILIVDDLQITELNEAYLDRPGPTNVIAFPMQEGPFGDIQPQLLGDVVISLDTAAREAQDADITTESRFDQLLVHGILHLFGFDHDNTAQESEAMRLKEEQILKLLYS
jgi:probable rRNA maturation factor